MNTGGDEHSAFAIDDQSCVVVADIERLEELGGNYRKLNCETHTETLKPTPISLLNHSLTVWYSTVAVERERYRKSVCMCGGGFGEYEYGLRSTGASKA